MTLIKPFRGLRPTRALAAKVAAHPYDVLNREEAYELAKDNPHSFLHINKPEVDIDPAVDVHDPSVYAKGRESLEKFISEGTLVRDEEERLYVYKQVMGEHEQVGIVAVASVDAYDKNRIKKHEFTRPDKEDDRVNHMDAVGAQVGPVFLTYKAQSNIDSIVKTVMQATPEYDFVADDNTRHVFWVVKNKFAAALLAAAVNKLDALYVADGHHRSAAASRVKRLHQERNPKHTGEEPYNWFLVVLFPHDQMQILDYNRLIKDLGELSSEDLFKRLEPHFAIEQVSAEQAKPESPREFALFIDANWYRLKATPELMENVDEKDPVKSLDVSILQDYVLGPLLGIHDQRTDKRVDFVGGIRGLKELEKRVQSGDWQAAIALYPTSIESLMAIADANEVMPPKSTWFEPKLKSGLVVHVLDS